MVYEAVLNAHLDRIAAKKIIGAPDLVVEVASPSTVAYDRLTKYDIYARSGVAEYWIVKPTSRTVEVLVLENREYRSLGIFSGQQTVQVLLKTLVKPKTVEDLYWALPWAHRHLVEDISKDLLLLPVDTAPQALPALLQALNNADLACRLPLETRYRRGSLAGPDIVHALLYFAFEGKPLPKNAVPFLLTTTQRAILTSILQSEAAWWSADQTAKLFDTFGLPYRGKLQELLLL